MKKRKGLKIMAAVLLILVLAVAVYAGDYYRADAAAVTALAGSETVTVEQNGNLTVFSPENPEAGFIFYPGGKVEHTAYAPLLLELAEEGIHCVLVKMPLNLAVLDVNAAEGNPGAVSGSGAVVSGRPLSGRQHGSLLCRRKCRRL